MSKTKRRAQAARRAKNVNSMPAVVRLLDPCLGCGERGVWHFVPPSLGDPGFYLCASAEWNAQREARLNAHALSVD